MRNAYAPKGESRHHGHDKLDFAYEQALLFEKQQGQYDDEFTALSILDGLRVIDGGDRDSVQVTAKKVSIEGVVWDDVDETATFANGVGNINGSDSAQSNNSWWAVHLIMNTKADDIALFLSTSRTAPTLPSDWPYFRYMGARRNNGSGDFYRMKNAEGSNEFAYNEDISAADNQVKNAVVAAANTWEDVDCSTPAPPGATHVHLDVLIYQTAPGLIICRWKDKDLGNIGNVNDTLSTHARRISAPIRVGVDASRVCRVQASSVVPTIEAYVKAFEDVR